MPRNDFTALPSEYDEVPEWFRKTLTDYVSHGVTGGSFFQAVMTNDLQGTISHADAFMAHRLPTIVRLLVNHVRSDAWGSEAKVAAWIKFHRDRATTVSENLEVTHG